MAVLCEDCIFAACYECESTLCIPAKLSTLRGFADHWSGLASLGYKLLEGDALTSLIYEAIAHGRIILLTS